ncbi:MAG: HAD family hydrolase [Candidatus Methylomirabilia bacterium]
MSFRAVLFDLFDTLVLFRRDRLPELRVNGRLVRTTAGQLLPLLALYAPHVDLARFHEALLASWRWAERIRASDHREVPAAERFEFLLRDLGLDPSALPSGLVPALLSIHKREISKVAELPPHHRALLEALSPRFQIGIVSNFDYAPTAQWILEREGVASLFQTVVISDQVGWRKPKPVIFETALAHLRVAPQEALFIGDRAEIDVLGAKGVGMAAAWINRDGEPLPEDVPKPDYELRDLAELATVLGL